MLPATSPIPPAAVDCVPAQRPLPCRLHLPSVLEHPFPFHRRAFPCSMTTFINALARACHVRVSFLDLKLTVTCFTRSQYPYSAYQIYLARGRLLRDKHTKPSKWVSAMFLIVAAASGCAPASAVLPRDWEVAARPPRNCPVDTRLPVLALLLLLLPPDCINAASSTSSDHPWASPLLRNIIYLPSPPVVHIKNATLRSVTGRVFAHA